MSNIPLLSSWFGLYIFKCPVPDLDRWMDINIGNFVFNIQIQGIFRKDFWTCAVKFYVTLEFLYRKGFGYWSQPSTDKSLFYDPKFQKDSIYLLFINSKIFF